MPARERADVIVVGLGVHGAAATLELAGRGLDVLALDRFPALHSRGSSHGRTRMIRRAYPSPAWDGLLERAYRGWERWEEALGTTLLHRTGGVYAHRGEARLAGPGTRVETGRAALAAAAPALRIPDDHDAVVDPDAGVLDAEAALAGAHRVAAERGAELATGERVLSWRSTASGVEVETDRRSLRARRLVLAAGSWLGTLVPRYAPLLEAWRIVTVSLVAGQPAGRPPELGAFSIEGPRGLVFGLPDVDGSGAKIGVDARIPWDPEIPVAAPDDAEIAERLDWFARLVPELEPVVADATACLYTMTEDRRFLVGPVPHSPSVVVAAACSGHGFKFGPAIGEAVADLVTGVDRPDLEFVGTARREAA